MADNVDQKGRQHSVRRGLAMIAALQCLSACGSRELQLCESSIKQQLKMPATYDRGEVRVTDSKPMSVAGFRQETGIAPNTGYKLVDAYRRQLEADFQGHRISVRTIDITFDAEDIYGMKIHSSTACRFKLIDGDLESSKLLDANAKVRQAVALYRRAYEIETFDGRSHRLPRPPAEPTSDCCL